MNQADLNTNIRKQKRIRSAEWMNALTPGELKRQVAIATQPQPQILKIVNDYSQIIFLQITNPYDTQMPDEPEWQAEVSWIQSNIALALSESMNSTLWIDEVRDNLIKSALAH